MTLIRSLVQIIAGFLVGVFLSLVLGVFYAYAVWDPPSNDWGNEKIIDGILLVPVILVLLVIAVFTRRWIYRGLRAIIALGPLGYIAILIGASIGPVCQLSSAAIEWRQVQADLPMHRDATLKQLSTIGVELKTAKSIVIAQPPILSPEELEKLYFRMALYTSKPVYVLITPGDKDAVLREYSVKSGDPCRQSNTAGVGTGPRLPLMTGDTCLTSNDLTDTRAFPNDGDLLSFPSNMEIFMYGLRHKDEKDGDLKHFMGVYYSIYVSALQKTDPPNTKYPYAENWTDLAQLKLHWSNWCSTKTAGDFPFARGVHWQVCSDVVSSPDIIDRIFGPSPDIH